MPETLTAELDTIAGVSDAGDPPFNPQAGSPPADNSGADDGSTPDGATPPADDAGKPSEADKRIEELTRKVKELEEDPDVLEARAKRLRLRMEPKADDEPAYLRGRRDDPAADGAAAGGAPAPAAVPQGNPEAAREQLLKELANDPIALIVKLSDAVAEKKIAARVNPLSGSVFTTTLMQYKAARSQFPIFRSVAPIFDQIVARMDRRQFANQTAEQIWETLEATEDMALGRGARLAYGQRVAPNLGGNLDTASAPNMGGAGAPAGTVGGRGGKPKVRPTKDMILLGRAANLSDEEIQKMAEEQAAAAEGEE